MCSHIPYTEMGREKTKGKDKSPGVLSMVASIRGFPFDMCILVVFFLGNYEGATHRGYMNHVTE